MIPNRLLRIAKNSFKSLVMSYRYRRQQRYHSAQGEKYYTILRDHLGRDLEPSDGRKIEEYSRDILGSTRFAPWLKLYTLCQGRFQEGWIPDDYFLARVLPALSQDLGIASNKRTIANRLFSTSKFPDIAYLINGRWYTTDYELISADKVPDQLFSEHEYVFVKKNDSLQGRGVYRVNEAGFEQLQPTLDQDCVVQRPIPAHPWFDRLYPHAVPAMRVTTTYLDGPRPIFRGAYLKVGYGGAALAITSQDVRIPIVDSEGTLGATGFFPNWRTTSKHPDTQFAFEGALIPAFPETVRACLELHSRLPQAQIIGWDVGITPEEEVEVIEWNIGHTDIVTHETTVGPIFKDCRFERFAFGRHRKPV